MSNLRPYCRLAWRFVMPEMPTGSRPSRQAWIGWILSFSVSFVTVALWSNADAYRRTLVGASIGLGPHAQVVFTGIAPTDPKVEAALNAILKYPDTILSARIAYETTEPVSADLISGETGDVVGTTEYMLKGVASDAVVTNGFSASTDTFLATIGGEVPLIPPRRYSLEISGKDAKKIPVFKDAPFGVRKLPMPGFPSCRFRKSQGFVFPIDHFPSNALAGEQMSTTIDIILSKPEGSDIRASISKWSGQPADHICIWQTADQWELEMTARFVRWLRVGFALLSLLVFFLVLNNFVSERRHQLALLRCYNASIPGLLVVLMVFGFLSAAPGVLFGTPLGFFVGSMLGRSVVSAMISYYVPPSISGALIVAALIVGGAVVGAILAIWKVLRTDLAELLRDRK